MASTSHPRRPTGCRIAAAEATGGPILHGAHARADRTYRDWKAAINDLWADEYEALLVEQAARAHQEEAAHHQRLLNEHAAHARQHVALLVAQAARTRQEEAAHRQRLLDEHAAHARQQEAARQDAARAAQCLLYERAALERLLDKRAAQACHEALVRHQCLIAEAVALE